MAQDTVQVEGMQRRFRWPSLGRVAVHTVLIVGSLLCVFPFLFMITKSFNSVYEATAWPPVWIPERWKVLNYSVAWSAETFGPTVEIEGVADLCPGRCYVYIEFWAVFLALSNMLVAGALVVLLSKRFARLREQPVWLAVIAAVVLLPTLTLFIGGAPCRVDRRDGYLPITPEDPARGVGRANMLEVLGYDRDWSYQPTNEWLLSWEADREMAPAVPISFWRFLGLISGAQADKTHRGYVLNTIVVSAITVPAVLVTSVLAAYAFSQLEFYGKNVLFVIFLSTMMIPPQAVLIPNYITVAGVLRWHDTFMALTVPFMASVFNIFLLRQFFMTIPSDYYDAARLDGAGHLGYLRHVVIPMSQSPLAVVTLFTFLGTWNSFQWPLIMVRDVHQLIQPGMSGFSGEGGTDTQLVMAAATFSVLPVALLYFLTQRTFIESVATSGLKG
ncbi:MAG: carbohydrate ABC transporter permease [Anaerolineae bacterium]|nr:carbohydrate ABC transporter permease [Anaerolineae bacterium]